LAGRKKKNGTTHMTSQISIKIKFDPQTKPMRANFLKFRLRHHAIKYITINNSFTLHIHNATCQHPIETHNAAAAVTGWIRYKRNAHLQMCHVH
jgi:hypothetical protein